MSMEHKPEYAAFEAFMAALAAAGWVVKPPTPKSSVYRPKAPWKAALVRELKRLSPDGSLHVDTPAGTTPESMRAQVYSFVSYYNLRHGSSPLPKVSIGILASGQLQVTALQELPNG